ncbi:hypothetical protein EDD36DRAFT_259159 [Exophiala viscosa]|uniref:DUF7730 domain-containing protein n=1 Tax=Exophiala viscosa TaxID=2486360 RepID=A0AAN6ID97_9EURO|nr:hypothetical protein EDD36DRAFT_259159 [Exophiala viscosa]
MPPWILAPAHQQSTFEIRHRQQHSEVFNMSDNSTVEHQWSSSWDAEYDGVDDHQAFHDVPEDNSVADVDSVSEEGDYNNSEYSWNSAASHDASIRDGGDDVSSSVGSSRDEVVETVDNPESNLSYERVLSLNRHPAEISGPSENPDLQLLSLPIEVRRPIWQYAMTKLWGDVRVSFLMLAGADEDYNRGYGPLRKGLSVGLALGRRNPVALLYVCRKIYQEAVPHLYGENRFVSFNVRGFQHCFVNDSDYGIGGANAAMIKKVSFGVPEPVKQDPANNLQGFVDFMSNTLMGVEEAELSIKYESYYVDPPTSGQRSSWSQERRSLLHTVACLAESHPKLKKAIWCSSSGGSMQTFWHGTKMIVRFAVHMVPVGKDLMCSSVGEVLNISGKNIQGRSVVLDCEKLRKTSWDDLLDKVPTEFELVEDAESFEVTVI